MQIEVIVLKVDDECRKSQLESWVSNRWEGRRERGGREGEGEGEGELDD